MGAGQWLDCLGIELSCCCCLAGLRVGWGTGHVFEPLDDQLDG